jgi:hypothetical protein
VPAHVAAVLNQILLSVPLQRMICARKDREIGRSSSVVKAQTLFCDMKSVANDNKVFQIAGKFACPFPKSVKFYFPIYLFFIELIGIPTVLR